MTRSSLRPLWTALLAAAAASTIGAPARAHDFWLSPSATRLEVGQVLGVTATIGHAGETEFYARNPKHIDRLDLIGPPTEQGATVTPLVGAAGKLPTGRAEVTTPGLHAAVYVSTGSTTTMEAGPFEDYLREEGLDWVIARRAELGESAAPGVEAFVRCAKALVQVGEPGADARDRPVGLPLELVAEFSPATHPVGEDERPEPVTLRLLWRGEPAEGVVVSAHALEGEDPPVVHARTDEQGRARFELPRGGDWYFAAVHMERAGPEEAVDWKSWWANLRVALPR